MRIEILEGPAAHDAAGHEQRAGTVRVVDEASAARALREAISGRPLLVLALAPRPLLDALYDDLRRIAQIDIRTEPRAPDPLTQEERGLLELLATGLDIREAAAELHLSARTADRRLASARRKLDALTTTEAIARISAGA